MTAQIQLKPTPEQHTMLKQTLELANAACNVISVYAWDNKEFGQYGLHNALYHSIRAEFPLSAQVVVRCIAKVADAYKKDVKIKRAFKDHGAISYDDRILRYFADRVSIWTIVGRLSVPFVCGDRQRELLQYQQGESDLVYQRGKWYLLATCNLPDPSEDEVERFLGIDRGMVNIAADSDGNLYQGKPVEDKRAWYAKRRKVLQRTGTKSSRRRLRQMGNRQARYQQDVNHCISKQLVKNAKRTKRGIALEDLKGIDVAARVRREDRAKRGNWAFWQLEMYIVYKAHLYGVPVKFVDPAYTSQRCAKCGHIEKANRKTQDTFLCVSCGHSTHADTNAALNISFLAAVKPPIVSDGKTVKPSFRR